MRSGAKLPTSGKQGPALMRSARLTGYQNGCYGAWLVGRWDGRGGEHPTARRAAAGRHDGG
jgi:hypothetical protein